MIGVRPDGTKELITVEDGYRESAESWKTPPVVVVGDGALGFWAAVRDVWPKTREQRGWLHKLGSRSSTSRSDPRERRLDHVGRAQILPLVQTGILFVDGVQQATRGHKIENKGQGGLITPGVDLGTDRAGSSSATCSAATVPWTTAPPSTRRGRQLVRN